MVGEVDVLAQPERPYSLDQFIQSLPQVDAGVSDKLATTQAVDRSEAVSAALLQTLANQEAMQQLVRFTQVASVAIAASHQAGCADHILTTTIQGNRNLGPDKKPDGHIGHIHDDEEDDDD